MPYAFSLMSPTHKYVTFAIILLTISSTFSKPYPKFDCAFIESKLANTSVNQVEFEQICDTPIVYRTWGTWNFNHSAAEIAAVALDFYRYPQVFRYVYKCDRITSPASRISPLGTWYVEGRATVARVWAIGNVDTIQWTDSTHMRFIAHQNEDRLLESQWKYSLKGWWNFRTRGVQIAAFVVATGPNTCRVGILAQGWVNKAMPVWLVRMATAVILPQLLQDLETEVARRIALSKPDSPTWYGKMWKNVKGLF